MRLIAFPVCIFLNVMLFGMCGYMYLLWLQYWHRLWAQKHQEPEYEMTMSDFRRNEMIVEYYDESSMPATVRPKALAKTDKEKHSPLVYFHKDMYPGKVADVRYHRYFDAFIRPSRKTFRVSRFKGVAVSSLGERAEATVMNVTISCVHFSV